MPKALNNEIMAILRQFGVADDESSRRNIAQAEVLEPLYASRVIRFAFERKRYYIVYDDSANDSALNILEEVRNDYAETEGRVVPNPHDDKQSLGQRFKGKEVYLFEVISPKKRLDLELSDRYPDLSRSTIQKYIKAGYVTVNEEVVTQARFEVTAGDSIAMKPPKATDHSQRELPVIYIDDDVIVVNKPVGVLTHTKGVMSDEFTVADFFRRYTTDGLETDRPGIVHRLDRDTSGVIIGARHKNAAELLKRQFADRKAVKTYIAVTDGVPKTEKAMIDLPIGRNPATPSQFRVDSGGKPAQTTYEVLASNTSHSLVRLHPKTGRTHQLRVHLQYLNTPIVGDKVYGRADADRLLLHAWTLKLQLPSGEEKSFEAPVPKEFTEHFPKVKL